MKVLEIAAGAVFVPTRLSLVRISIRDQVADGNSLVRNSGVGGGGQNLIALSQTMPSQCCNAGRIIGLMLELFSFWLSTME